MSLFGGLTNEGLEETQDRLGGFSRPDSDAYDATIKLFYAGQSDGGARSITVVADIGGQDYTETLWVTNKQGENFFLNKQDKTKKVPLPGFTMADDICVATTEKTLADTNFEEKVVNIYDYDQKKEVPKSVMLAVDLIGKPVTLGIVKQLVNKNAKNDSTGEYEPTAESREENVIDKVFHTATKLTMVEARQGANEAKFYPSWVDRNKGVTRDRRKIKDSASGGTAGRPGGNAGGPPAAGTAAPKKSLFGGNS